MSAVTCCKPRSVPFPSGYHRVHSSTCPQYPNAKVGSERKRPKTSHLGPTDPHPVCAAAHSFGSTTCSRCAPLVHAVDCGCEPCEYASAHSDDDLVRG